jgi:hypothetical protein
MQREKIIVLWSAKAAESAGVKSWEIIADNPSEAGWSWGLSINEQFQRANGLFCGCAPRRRKALYCARRRKAQRVC